MIEFTVPGQAVPAGSKKMMPKGNLRFPLTVLSLPQLFGLLNVTDDSGARGRQWREVIQWHARAAMKGRAPLEGPLVLTAEFWIERPKKHWGKTGLRRTAPAYPTGPPDTTKLLRGLEDALTGFVWVDDAQVVEQTARKVYGEPARVEVLVEPWL